MATRVWQGYTPAVAQVSTFAVTLTWATNDTATLTCGASSVTFTVAGTETAAAVVIGLVAAWNNSAAGEMTGITASGSVSPITLTSDTSGVPFTVTSSEVTAGDGVVGDQVDATANAGPNCWDVATNWSGGAVPVDADAIVLENGNVDILYGLDQSAVTPASINSMASYTGKIGLPRTNAAGYVEYRDTYLKICDAADATNTTVYIGLGEGSGSGRIKLDTNAGQVTMTVDKTGARAETGIPALLWKGTHASNAVHLNRGTMGVAFFGGEAATLLTLNIGYLESPSSDSDVRCSSGLTLSTLDMDGGKAEINANTPTINIRAGTLHVKQSATCASALTVNGGTVYWNSVGTVTQAYVSGGGVLDFRRNTQSVIVSNCDVYENGNIYDPAGRVTWSNGIRIMQTSFSGVTLEMPEGRKWTPTST